MTGPVQRSSQVQPVSGATDEERKNALIRALAEKAKKAGIPPELLIMTALVESSFGNPNGGDLDSVGMFQQRNAWGSRADRLDPLKAADMFINGGQGGQPGALDYKSKYESMGPDGYGAWCQAVQVSALPGRYQQQLGKAEEMLKAAGETPLPGDAALLASYPVGPGTTSAVAGGDSGGSGGSTDVGTSSGSGVQPASSSGTASADTAGSTADSLAPNWPEFFASLENSQTPPSDQDIDAFLDSAIPGLDQASKDQIKELFKKNPELAAQISEKLKGLTPEEQAKVAKAAIAAELRKTPGNEKLANQLTPAGGTYSDPQKAKLTLVPGGSVPQTRPPVNPTLTVPKQPIAA